MSPVNSEVLVDLKNIESPECKSMLTYEWKIKEVNWYKDTLLLLSKIQSHRLVEWTETTGKST